MSEIFPCTKKLISQYQFWLQSLQRKEGVSVIHVDEVASQVASFYEKIRGVIDWREEHLLRRSAIERMLRRRILTKEKEEKIAGALILDLIRGGHFPNDTIPEAKIESVQRSVDKYVYILTNAPKPATEEIKNQFIKWIFSAASCEVEAILAPPIREEALMEYMEGFMKERIWLNEGAFVFKKTKEEEKNTQIFIAIRRALFKLDNPIITFHLLKKWYPNWTEPSTADLEEITKKIYQVQSETEKALNHRLSEKFYKLSEKYDTVYLILGDIISKNPTEAVKTFENPSLLENSITQAYGERFLKVRERTRRAAIYSTLSIFITKVFLALALEIPIDKYITGQFSLVALGINVIIPPFLMFLLVVSVRPPGKTNMQRVIMEVMKIVYLSKRKEIYELKVPPKRGKAFRTSIDFLYFVTYLLIFGVIVSVLKKLDFGVLSMLIFLIFLCLIAFAGVKIQQRARELEVEEKKEGFFSSVRSWLVLPIIKAGKWLSQKWEKHNALVLVFNSLIDMPFQTFVEFLEQWRYFLKEKKEEIH